MTTFLILVAGFLGGASNALIGGGQFLIFPALLVAGIAPVEANATASLVVLPGAFASAWVFRGLLQHPDRKFLATVSLASLIGSALGGGLLLLTPNATFSGLVPWLLLTATIVFTLAPRLRNVAPKEAHESTAALLISQTIISVYGGYFGAGMGVFMIALYLVVTKIDLQTANAVRMMCACIVNVVAVLIFAWRGALVYRAGMPMLLSAILGSCIGAWAVKRTNAHRLRIAMLFYVWGLTAWFFFRRISGS